MKKTILPFIIIIIFIVSTPSVFAADMSADINEIYRDQYEASGAKDLENALPDSIKDQMEEFDIGENGGISSESIDIGKVFGKITDFINGGYKAPLAAGCSMIAVLLIAGIGNFAAGSNGLLKYALCLGLTAVSIVPIASAIVEAVNAVRTAGIFMLAFVPVYAAILAAAGKALTAAGYSAVMLTVSEGVSMLCSFILLPLCSMQLALGIGGALMPDLGTDSLAKTIKKISNWMLGLASTVLLGVLGLQTSVSSASDTLTAKAAKFIVGTTVPVVGNAVSEALGTVRGCINVLRSSVAVYGIIAVALIILPLVTELLLWRLSVNICSTAADVLSQSKASALLKAADSALSFILGIIVLIFMLFIISLTVVMIV